MLVRLALLLLISNAAFAEATFRATMLDAGKSAGKVHIQINGDVSGDGLPDLVLATGKGVVTWFDNLSLKPHSIVRAPFEWNGAGAVVDIEGDNANDIVLASWKERKLYWLKNPGQPAGTWTLHTVGTVARCRSIDVADLDSDKRVEVVTGSPAGLQVWQRGGTDKWTGTIVPGAPANSNVRSADVNRDGKLDLIAGGSWFENGGEGKWTAHVIDAQIAAGSALATADINHDYRTDLVATSQSGTLAWYENPLHAAANEPWTRHVVAEGQGGATSLAVADFDLDGSLDVLTDSARLVVYRNCEGGSAWTRQAISASAGSFANTFDRGGDGDYDVAAITSDRKHAAVQENLLRAPGARHFVLFDGIVTYAGKRRLWENWDFVMKLPVAPGAPKNWLAPVNFVDGKLKFDVDVLEMSPVEKPVSVHMGWWNREGDPEIRHTAGAPIEFDKPGHYSTVVPIRAIRAFYGAGPRENARVSDWDWFHAYADGRFYSFIQPKKNLPGKEGFPYKIRATVTIYAKGEEP